MTYDPKAIANYFLDVAADDPVGLSPMKLHKLVYFAHGWHLALTSVPLIDEQVEAWRYGPVINSLFQEFKDCGGNRIDRHATAWTHDGLHEYEPRIGDDAEDANFVKSVLERVWQVYGGYSATKLSNMTHKPGTPWHRTVHQDWGGSVPMHTDIPVRYIAEYFVRPSQPSLHD